MSAMTVKKEDLKPNPKNPMTSVYSVTLRGTQNSRVAESPISMGVNAKSTNRFKAALDKAPLAVSLLGVYAQPGKNNGDPVAMPMSDNAPISVHATLATQLLDSRRGRSFYAMFWNV